MPIDLGLGRIQKLLSHLGNPHKCSYKSIHIAGTNGKGSTVAYLSSILTSANVRNGRFTSPHLISYNDCIAIDDRTYSKKKFEEVRRAVLNENHCYNLGCTEFEILTATAFKIFQIEDVELAIVEVGLGGRLDATNVLEPCLEGSAGGGVIACGITKIGMDHEGLLGDTISAIAKQKAGIIKQSIPVVIDHTNKQEVLTELTKKAKGENAPVITTNQKTICGIKNPLQYSPLLGEYQSTNLAVALQIVETLRKIHQVQGLTRESIITGIKSTSWPGRLQMLEDERTGLKILLDGAHNECASLELAKHLETVRKDGYIFVVGMSEGKSLDDLLKHVVSRNVDAVVPFQFSAPQEMPWVRSYNIRYIASVAKKYSNEIIEVGSEDVARLFSSLAARKNNGDYRQVVVCGSLYLCSDILRYIQST